MQEIKRPKRSVKVTRTGKYAKVEEKTEKKTDEEEIKHQSMKETAALGDRSPLPPRVGDAGRGTKVREAIGNVLIQRTRSRANEQGNIYASKARKERRNQNFTILQ